MIVWEWVLFHLVMAITLIALGWRAFGRPKYREARVTDVDDTTPSIETPDWISDDERWVNAIARVSPETVDDSNVIPFPVARRRHRRH